MRGRKPKPTALHELQGTTNVTRHRARKAEPVAEGDLLAIPPGWLSPTQADAWRFAVTHAPKGVLRRIDAGVLAVWVEASDRHRVATTMQAKLDANNTLPLLFRQKIGAPTVSPYVTIITKAALVMMKAASEMGFSPVSRPRLAADEPDSQPANAFAALRVINGGKIK